MPATMTTTINRANYGVQFSGVGVDRESRCIRGVIVMELGAARDDRSDRIVDEVTLAQCVVAGNSLSKGAAVKFDHVDLRADNTMGYHMGRLREFRVDDEVVRADFYIAKSASISPHGDLAEYVMSLAEEDPESMNLSVVMDQYLEEIEGTESYAIRVHKLWGVDLVNEGALTSELYSVVSAPSADSERRKKMDPTADAGKTGDTPVVPPDKGGGKEPDQGKDPGTQTPAPATPVPKSEPATRTHESAVRAERERVVRITAMATKLGLSEVGDELIESGVSYSSACQTMLEHQIAETGTRTTASRVNPDVASVEVRREAMEKYRDVVLSSFCRKGNLIDDAKAIESNLGSDAERVSMALSTRRFAEVARDVLTRAGYGKSIEYMDDMKVLGCVLSGRVSYGMVTGTTSDFSYIMDNYLNKILLNAYKAQRSTWNLWTRTGSTRDFKPIYYYRVSESDDLVLKPEGGEYKDSKISDSREAGSVATYGRKFTISREALINDDMNQINQQPERFGRATCRLIDHLLYTDLLDAAMGPMMGDGSRLFLDYGSVGAGTGNWFDNGDVEGHNSTLDEANAQYALKMALGLLRKKTDMSGKQPLSLNPSFLLIPPELEFAALEILNSTSSFRDHKNTGVKNPVHNLATPIVIPHLSNTDAYANASETAWYLLSNDVEHYQVIFLNGQQEPYMEQKEDFDTDGRTYKVRMDVGVKCVDRVGFVKSKGA